MLTVDISEQWNYTFRNFPFIYPYITFFQKRSYVVSETLKKIKWLHPTLAKMLGLRLKI